MFAFIGMLLMYLALTVGLSTAANGELRDCGELAGYELAPTWGAVSTYTNLRDHWVTFRLKLNASQIRTLRCLANYVEIDFELRNSGLPASWEDYYLSTDLPHGMKDTPFQDTGNPRPSATNVHTKLLQAGRIYTVSISWSKSILFRNDYDQMMAVRLYWQPSYWAESGTLEKGFCKLNGKDPRYCLFGGNGRSVVKLHDCFFRLNNGGWLLFRAHREVAYKMNHNFHGKCIKKN
jgi:hypothetical protein